MGGALDLEEHRHLVRRPARRRRSAACATGSSVGDRGELHLLLEPVAGDVRRRRRRPSARPRRGSRRASARRVVDEAEHGVAHDQRRLGRVEDDDRLAAPRAADRLDGRATVVSVNSSMLARVPGPADLRRDRGDDLGVGDRARPRLTAATIGIVAWPPQVTMLTFAGVEVLVEVDRRDDVRADRGRASGRSAVLPYGAGARRWPRGALAEVASKTISMSSKPGSAMSPRRPRAVVGDAQPARRGRGRRSRGRCRPSRPSRGASESREHLDHQVGADVARADDGDLGFLRSCSSRRPPCPLPAGTGRTSNCRGWKDDSQP